MEPSDKEEPNQEPKQSAVPKSEQVAIKQPHNALVWAAIGAIAVASLVVSYAIGYATAKHHQNENVAAVERRQEHAKEELRSTNRIVQRAVRGTIESSNTTNITIKKVDSNESATYTITKETKIIKDGQTVATSDLTAGSSVAIHVSANTSAEQKTANIIVIDPQASINRG